MLAASAAVSALALWERTRLDRETTYMATNRQSAGMGDRDEDDHDTGEPVDPEAGVDALEQRPARGRARHRGEDREYDRSGRDGQAGRGGAATRALSSRRRTRRSTSGSPKRAG